jgi:cyanate permease
MEINVRENRRGNQEWTIQRHWQHWVHKTQVKDKQNKKNTMQYDDKSRLWTDPILWQLKPLYGIPNLPILINLNWISNINTYINK